MKATFAAALAAIAAQQVAAHATFQQLWVGATDQGSKCVRTPNSNSPISSLDSPDIACNAGGARGVAGKCSVAAGGMVTIEMHQQPGQRSCGQEGIGGAHYGPVQAYMSKVSNSATADPTAGTWFKVFSDAWSSKGPVGDEDNWGTKDLNANCGRLDFKIPSDIAAGDYLLRAEVIALHAAGPGGGAQPYASCFQLTVTGGGGNNPSGVKFPGAYKSSDPGIGINIHQKLNNYIAPGPAVIPSGTTVKAGTGSSANGKKQVNKRRSMLAGAIGQ